MAAKRRCCRRCCRSPAPLKRAPVAPANKKMAKLMPQIPVKDAIWIRGQTIHLRISQIPVGAVWRNARAQKFVAHPVKWKRDHSEKERAGSKKAAHEQNTKS